MSTAIQPEVFDLTLRPDGTVCIEAEDLSWPADPDEGETEHCQHRVAVITTTPSYGTDDPEGWVLRGYFRMFWDPDFCTRRPHEEDGVHDWKTWIPDWEIVTGTLADALAVAQLWMSKRIGSPMLPLTDEAGEVVDSVADPASKDAEAGS